MARSKIAALAVRAAVAIGAPPAFAQTLAKKLVHDMVARKIVSPSIR